MAGRKRPKPSQTTVLIDLVHARYDVMTDVTGQTFVAARTGPRIALPLSTSGAFARQLTREFYDQMGTAPGSQALAGALRVIEAEATDQERIEIHLRCAGTQSGLVLDLGDVTGRVVVVRNGRWRVRETPPAGVVFRRTQMTAPLPTPRRGGDLDALRALAPVDDAGWDLLRAWLVLAWMPHVSVPILSITGRQGAGKSVLARTIVSIVDPSAAPIRSAPRDILEWQTTAAASRVVALDNVSRISQDLSDALCRAVSGEGAVKRRLYTDQELIVQTFRRAVILTSIDPGSLRGDLGERLMPIELSPLRKKRVTEQSIMSELARRIPVILGGLLDVVADVLANPVPIRHPPRMADAAHVMAAVDQAVDSSSLSAYRQTQSRVVEIVLESDPLASAVLDFMANRREGWAGTATDLRSSLLVHHRDGKNWPANPRSLSQRLARIAPALEEAHGLVIARSRGDQRLIELKWSTRGPKRAHGAVARRRSRQRR